jgi:hypothetical protein
MLKRGCSGHVEVRFPDNGVHLSALSVV